MKSTTFFHIIIPVIGGILAILGIKYASEGISMTSELASTPGMPEAMLPALEMLRRKFIFVAVYAPLGAALIAIGFVSRAKGASQSAD